MLDFVKRVTPLLRELDQKPQFTYVGEFPFAALEKHLQTLLQDDSISLIHKEKGFVALSEIEAKRRNCYAIALPPLEEPLYLSLDEDALVMLASGTTKRLPEDMKEGLVSYFIVEMMHKVHTEGVFETLSFSLQSEQVTLSQESYFAVDIGIQGKMATLWLSLFISPSFRERWNQHFAGLPELPLTDRQKEQLQVELSITAGESSLTVQESKSLKEGDFLLLDRCLYDPETKKGSLLLTLNGTHLFRGKVKESGLKLADYLPYNTEVAPMDEEEFEDEDDLYGDTEEEEEEEELAEEEGEDEEEEIEAEEEEKVEGDVVSPPEVSISDVEVNVVVEVCRVRMSAKELLELSSGNLLELGVPLERGVDLVVNGKRFGKGELQRVGEHLGVRILTLSGS